MPANSAAFFVLVPYFRYNINILRNSGFFFPEQTKTILIGNRTMSPYEISSFIYPVAVYSNFLPETRFITLIKA